MKIGNWLLGMLCTLGTCAGLKGLAYLDRKAAGEEKFCRISMWQTGGLCGVGSIVALAVWRKWWTNKDAVFSAPLLSLFLLAVLAGCLLAACIMDVETHAVYDYVWWIGTGTGILQICLEKRMIWGTGLVCFVLLQELLFCRMYGKADSHAFCVCALWESACGLGLKIYLLHMLCSFGFLAVLQLVKKNVETGGKLKTPVPFLPYIAVGFGIVMLLLP